MDPNFKRPFFDSTKFVDLILFVIVCIAYIHSLQFTSKEIIKYK